MSSDSKSLSGKVSCISIVNNENFKPYIELFSKEPENITEEPMGTLFGVFKISDTGVDSAYIVNFLTSVLKKEYYSNSKRTPEEAFEGALHKVNIALSEIAGQGNTEWFTSIEGAIAVFSKNTLYISTTGNASIFLYRNNKLASMSEGLSNKEEDPLKTFTDIASGRLSSDDSILLTTSDLLDIIPKRELEHRFRNFSPSELEQFIHTVLINERDFAGSVLFFPQAKNSLLRKFTKEKEVSLPENVFSSDAFSDESSSSSDRQETLEKNPREIHRQKNHIYIQQEKSVTSSSNPLDASLPLWKEKCATLFDTAKQSCSCFFRKTSKTTGAFFKASAHLIKQKTSQTITLIKTKIQKKK